MRHSWLRSVSTLAAVVIVIPAVFGEDDRKPGQEDQQVEVFAFLQDTILRARLVTERGTRLTAKKGDAFLVAVIPTETLGTRTIDGTETLQIIDGANARLPAVAAGVGVGASHVKHLCSRTFVFFDIAEEIRIGERGALILAFVVPEEIKPPAKVAWKGKEYRVKLVTLDQWKDSVWSLAFEPSAVVTLGDGSNIEVAEFSFYGHHERSRVYFRGRSYSDSVLLVKQDRFWRSIRIGEIKNLECQAENSLWLTCSLTLFDTSEPLRGKIPVDTEYTWLNGNRFELSGKSQVLRTEGTYKLDLSDLRALRPHDKKPKTWLIKAQEGKETKETEVTELVLRRWHEGNPFSGGPPAVGAYHLALTVGAAEVQLKPEKLDTVVFFEPERKAKVRTVDKEEAEGTLSGKNARVYGKLKDGRVLFEPISSVRSVKFVKASEK